MQCKIWQSANDAMLKPSVLVLVETWAWKAVGDKAVQDYLIKRRFLNTEKLRWDCELKVLVIYKVLLPQLKLQARTDQRTWAAVAASPGRRFVPS